MNHLLRKESRLQFTLIIVRGTPWKTILHKADSVESPLAIDGDFGEEQITVTDPKGFNIGCEVAIWSKRVNGFHTTVAGIIGRNGSTLALDHPLGGDCMVSDDAKAVTVFPMISGYELEGVRIEHLFRNETLGVAGYHNRLENNLIENKGRNQDMAGIRIRGETWDVLLKNNRIRDTRPSASRRQNTGIRLEEKVGPVNLEGNNIETKILVEDQRREACKDTKPVSNP
ncbi:MAG: hypothetical protein AB9869_23220 [Verrucomicrobiia bacterium]|jgi:hypothetical protein